MCDREDFADACLSESAVSLQCFRWKPPCFGLIGGPSIVQIGIVPQTTPHSRGASLKGVFVLRSTSPASKTELSLIPPPLFFLLQCSIGCKGEVVVLVTGGFCYLRRQRHHWEFSFNSTRSINTSHLNRFQLLWAFGDLSLSFEGEQTKAPSRLYLWQQQHNCAAILCTTSTAPHSVMLFILFYSYLKWKKKIPH